MHTKDLDSVILSADIHYYAKKKKMYFGDQGKLGKQEKFASCVFAHSQMCMHVHQHDGRLAGVKLTPDNADQKSVQSGKNGTCG